MSRTAISGGITQRVAPQSASNCSVSAVEDVQRRPGDEGLAALGE